MTPPPIMSLPSSSDPESSHPDLPELKLPRREGSGSGAIRIPEREFSQDGEDGCQTPTSEGHRIPELMMCPPAPRKTVGRKRGRSEVASLDAEMFKATAVSVSNAEVEEFFRRIESVKDQERIRVVVKGDGRRKKSVALQLR